MLDFLQQNSQTIMAITSVVGTIVAACVYWQSRKSAEATVREMRAATEGELRAYLHMKGPRLRIGKRQFSDTLEITFVALFVNSGRTPAYQVYAHIAYKHPASRSHAEFPKMYLLQPPKQYRAIGAGEMEEISCATTLEQEVFETFPQGSTLDLQIWVVYTDIFGAKVTWCMECYADIRKMMMDGVLETFVPLVGVYREPCDREILVVSPIRRTSAASIT